MNQKIGYIDKTIFDVINVSANVIIDIPGLKIHIKRKHEHELRSSILNNLEDYLKCIIKEPDYYGQSPKDKNKNSLELVKKFDNNYLLAIKLSKNKQYYYVASLYLISQNKVNNRINSKRLKKF